jgi:hypothetical protein
VKLQEFQRTTKPKECDRNVHDKIEIQENFNSVKISTISFDQEFRPQATEQEVVALSTTNPIFNVIDKIQLIV